MEGIFGLMATCTGLICTSGFCLLILLIVTLVFRKRVDVRKLRITQLITVAITLIIGCYFTYSLVGDVLAGPPSPKKKPAKEEAIGTWVLSQSTLDFRREEGYEGLMPGFILRENGTFTMDGVPAPIFTVYQDVSGEGTWSIQEDGNRRWPIILQFTQFNGMESDFYTSVDFYGEEPPYELFSWAGEYELWVFKRGPYLLSANASQPKLFTSVVFRPDGERMATADSDNTIRMWDPKTGLQTGESLTGHRDKIFNITYSPNGDLIASASRDGTIRLWNPTTGEQLGEPLIDNLPSYTYMYAIAFSPGGDILAGSGSDTIIHLWDTETRQIIKEITTEHDSAISSLSFSPDGNLLISTGYDKIIRLWDPISGNLLDEIVTDYDDVYGIECATFSPDGKLIAGIGNSLRSSSIRLYDPISGSQVGKPFPSESLNFKSIVFSPDGKLIASIIDYENTVQIWDPSTGQLVSTISTDHESNINSIAFSPDGELITSTGSDRTIRLWDVNTHERVGKPFPERTYAVRNLAFSPDGNYLASGGEDKTVHIWMPKIGQEIDIFTIEPPKLVLSLAYSPDGRILAIGTFDGDIHLVDSVTGFPVLDPLTVMHSARSLSFHPYGKLLVSGGDFGIDLWDLASGMRVGDSLSSFENQSEPVISVAFSPDGSIIASADEDGIIRLWDSENTEQLGDSIIGDPFGLNSIAFNPDGEILASAGFDGAIRLWDPNTGALIGNPFTGHEYGIRSITFSPDGNILASGGDDNIIRLWNPHTGEQIGNPLVGHSGAVLALAFSPNGEILASASMDGSVRLWNPDTGQPVGEPLISQYSYYQESPP
ncbi:MAG: hypothetical protein AMJ53_10385 [Gammaproteobacteria bacterium SG8_11]|nr:MAG: hypothetical protein AMJ53_10385 [Gammaproteobacteria bacterium SG8_11]